MIEEDHFLRGKKERGLGGEELLADHDIRPTAEKTENGGNGPRGGVRLPALFHNNEPVCGKTTCTKPETRPHSLMSF